jgi:O-methyltransferase
VLQKARIAADHARCLLTAPTEYRLFRKYGAWSMIPRRRFIENLRLVSTVTAPGELVECGCWRGGMSGAMAEALPGRTSWLFDSFEGLPPARDIDGLEALAFSRDLSAPDAVAAEAMRRSGQRFEIMKGWFEETVPKFAATATPIAVLRLDGDWYDSTMICLEELFPLVVSGGLVIIDDYGDWEGCTRAVHDYLSRESRHEPIEHDHARVAYLRKH